MSTNVLESVQASLTERGVRDVKFYFSNAVGAKPHSDVAKEIAYVLDTYLRGDSTPMKPIGDSQTETI